MPMLTSEILTANAHNEYLSACEAASTEPTEFENQVLSIAGEHLPTYAREVRGGGDPTAEYWGWLTDQLESGTVAREGDMIELCQSNYPADLARVVEYRTAERNELLPDLAEPFFWRLTPATELEAE